MTVHDHVAAARDRLVRAGISLASAGLDAEVLARYLLGWDRATYVANRHDVAPDSFDSGYARSSPAGSSGSRSRSSPDTANSGVSISK